jgi:hypothetical protein
MVRSFSLCTTPYLKHSYVAGLTHGPYTISEVKGTLQFSVQTMKAQGNYLMATSKLRLEIRSCWREKFYLDRWPNSLSNLICLKTQLIAL